MKVICVFTILSLWILQAWAAKTDDIKDPDLKSFFEGDYDGTKPPSDDTTFVKLGVYVHHMSLVPDKQELKLHVYLRQSWTDKRFDKLISKTGAKRVNLHGIAIDLSWTPDTFVRNALEVNPLNTLTDQRLFRINDKSEVWFVQTVDMVVSCYSSKNKVKTHFCGTMFESYSHTTDVLEYKWLDSPVQVDPGIHLPHTALLDKILYDCTQNYTAGSFPCLEIKFLFERDIDNPFTNGLFVFSLILVVASWVTFWIDGDQLFKRCGLGLGVLLLLAMCNISIAMSPTLRHNYGVQLWTTFCTLFGSLTLVEYMFIHGAFRIIPRTLRAIRSGVEEKDPEPSKADKVAKKIDIVCGLIIFPVIFLLFVIFFFAIAPLV